MGHEAAGEVAQLGSGVTDLQVGDRVTFDSDYLLLDVFFCARGELNLCENREVVGVSPDPYRRHGVFAEFVAVHLAASSTGCRITSRLNRPR